MVSRGNLQNPIFIVKESTDKSWGREREEEACWTKQNDWYIGPLSGGKAVEKRERERFLFYRLLGAPLSLLQNSASLALSGPEEKETKAGEFVTVACEFWGRHSKLIAPRWQDIWSFIYIERLHGTSISP